MPNQAGSTQLIRSGNGPWREDPDVQRMQRVVAGDHQAFAELRERYASRVLGLLVRLLQHRNDAEDALQEVFLRLYRSRHRYQPRAGFATWIFHIAHNVARNAQRTRRRKPLRCLDFTESRALKLAEMNLPCTADSPELRSERLEQVQKVRQAIAALGGRSAQALQLHQLEGRTCHEVANALQITPKAAKSLLYRARNQLREMLHVFQK
ncbi:MAG: RNA polymerase sigma factor [Gemmataceae bacterium]